MSTQLKVLVSVWQELKKTRSRNQKKEILQNLFRGLTPDEIEPAVALFLGLPGLTLNISFATIHHLQPQATLFSTRIGIRTLYERFKKISKEKGAGSSTRRRKILEEIYSGLDQTERTFITGAILNELRCGVSEGVLIEALSQFSGVEPSRLKSKLSFTGSTSSFFKTVITGGKKGLSAYRPKLLSPIRPMLAKSVNRVEEVFEKGSPLSFEYKVDGVRIQIHRLRNKIKVYSRSLKDLTAKFPELTAFSRELPATSFILDGEVVGINHQGRPLPFQETMRRFGSEQRFKVIPVIFDLLMLNGKPMLKSTYHKRRQTLEGITDQIVPRITTHSPFEAKKFLKKSLAAGHEGLVAKNLDGLYLPGKRSDFWLKIKPYQTLDLVITAAEWGHGRRRGWLSNLHLACRGARGLLPLGKTFKGLSDKELEILTRRLLRLKESQERHTVYVKPEIVCEVSFNEIQRSPHYSSGFALRFARIKAIREDKTPAEINTIDDV
ncbi:MAG TPA: ATP-dependent DNA ligase, partial [bacterium (Candidatus Stahlbacteria)]|nr:ATP-dependent DNA ligase [Candidatus Stahlbacteria bacterium]